MFVHLRLHSEYSVVDGTLRIDDAVSTAAADGQPAMALTDLSNLFGAIKFYKAARAAGVKPVLGAEVFVQGLDGDGGATPGQPLPPSAPLPPRVLLLVMDSRGYHNLSELLAKAWTQNVQRDQAVVAKLAQTFVEAAPPVSVAAFTQEIASDLAKWTRVVREARIEQQ